MTQLLPETFADGTTIDIGLEKGSITYVRKVNWTSALIEQQVASLAYSGENLLRDAEVEKAKLPPFALAFYKFLFFKGQIPTEQELWTQYLIAHFGVLDETRIQFFRKGTWRVYKADAVKARLFRSFPSLIRDFHFFVLCQESGRFQEVKYSLRDDYFNGVDLTLTYQNKTFRVAVMLNSERARQFKEQKYSRHAETDEQEVILLFDLPRSEQNKGKIKLFSSQHIQQLITELEKRTHELPRI
ncbi:MAG: hypothetical protein LCH91_16435 [Bacteroidetes bacterium]|nr:hypothetical protein [Bacteroidota bacterium]